MIRWFSLASDFFETQGKAAFVTGASSGLGAHFSKVLAASGAKVAVCARRVERLHELVDDIVANGGVAIAVRLDVTDPQSVHDAFDEAEGSFGTMTVVCNNAGVSVNGKMAISTKEQDWDKVMDVNLKGAWLVAVEAARRAVAARQPCSIINTASILGLRVALAQSTYATSKAALIQLTRCLALEWSRKKIRVNALCPGYFLSEMNEDYFATTKGKDYMMSMPLQRLGRLDELTGPLLLLASDAGSFINGVALPVDGAHSLSNM